MDKNSLNNDQNEQIENGSNNLNNNENGSTQSQNNTQISQEEQKNIEICNINDTNTNKEFFIFNENNKTNEDNLKYIDNRNEKNQIQNNKNNLNNNFDVNGDYNISKNNFSNSENINNQVYNNIEGNDNNFENKQNNNEDYQSIQKYLNFIQQYSESSEMYNNLFRNKLCKDYQMFLNFNSSSDIEQIKQYFIYICGYLKIRLNYLNIMTLDEIKFIVFMTKPNLPFYNNNIIFQNYYDINNSSKIIEYKIFLPILQRLFPEMKQLNNSYKKINPNISYKFLLEFLYQEKFLNKFDEIVLLKRKDLDLVNFYELVNQLSPLFLYYDKKYLLEDNLVIKYIQIINEKNDILLKKDELKNIDKFELDTILKNKIYIYLNLTSEIFLELIETNFEDLKNLFCKDLYLSYKLLKSNNLERRIIGIEYLTHLYFSIEHDINFSNYSNFKEINQLTKNCLLNFLIEIDFYNLIFGENIHEAILSRAPLILVFLYKNNKLTNEHIFNLWKLYQEKHQSIGESILKIFGELITVFSNEQSNFVLKIISDMNYKDINDNTLKILENFSKINVRNENLLNILFKFSIENSYYEGLSSNIILKSRNILCNFLLKEEYINDLVKFIKKCIYMIGCNNNVNTYLYLLRNLLELIKNYKKKEIYQAFNTDINDYNSLLKYLDNKYTLISIILFSLISIKKEILFFVSEIQKAILNKNDMETISNENEIMNDYNEDKYNNQNNENLINHDDINSRNNNNLNNNQNQYNNLDLTQSTEKNFEDNIDNTMDIDNENIDMNENSFYSINTDIPNFEKKNKIIIQNFIDSYQKELQSKDFSLKENYDFVFRELQINFQGQNYENFINYLLDFLKSLLYFSSLQLTKEQIEYLYIILVKERIDDFESNIFYLFFSDIIKSQILKKSSSLSEENIIYLCLNLFYKDDSLSNITPNAFFLIRNFFIYINSIHNNITFDNNSNIIKSIHNFSCLISFKTIWKIYLLSNNIKIYELSISLLNNIFSIISTNKNDRQILFNEIFKEISIYNNISRKKETIDIIKNLINLLSILHKCKINLNCEEENDNNISLIFDYGKEIKLSIPKDLKIKNLKQSIIENIIDINENCLKKNISKNEIMLQYKGKVLKDNYTIIDYNIEDNSKILVFNITTNHNNKYEISDIIFQKNLNQLKNFFDYIDDEILIEALKKNDGNLEDTSYYLSDNYHIEIIKKEIEEKKNQKLYNGNFKNVLNYTEEKINLLLSLLDYNDKSISNFIWKLFSELKFPYSILNIILNKNFEEIFDEKKERNQILFILKLTNSIIFKDDFYNLIDLNQNIRNNWINDLIINNQIMKKYLEFIQIILDNTKSNCGIELNILFILLNWIKEIILKINDLIQNENIKESISKITTFFQNKELLFEIISRKNAEIFINFLHNNNFFSNVLWNLTGKLIEKNEKSNDSYYIKCFDILFEIILIYSLINDTFLTSFLINEINTNLIIDLLFNSKNKDIRVKSFHFFKIILYYINPIIFNNPEFKGNDYKSLIKRHIINNYKKLFTNDNINEEFIALFGGIIPSIESYIDFGILIKNVIRHIITLSDKLIINEEMLKYLQLFKALFNSTSIYNSIKENVENNEKNIINILLHCLFYLNPENSYKEIKYIYSDLTIIKISYEILELIQKLSPNYSKYIIDYILSLFDNFELNENIINEVDISLREKDDKFIGLKNYGATCYLNSLVQQFFMNPSFKYILYQFKIENENIDNSIISNMQIAFTNLKYSWMKYYPLINFIKSFKVAFNSEPINVKIQQDSDEFLAILCDEIEKEAKKYNKENCLEESFKGKISNEIVSLEMEYPYYSCKDESFIKLTLDIKGHKNLEEALDFFIKEEILEGENKYFIDKYNKKISIRKRCSIKKLSNTVIIHLKRFEFDYYTFTNNKLNDYLKFPQEINFKKWTKAFLNSNTENKSLISEEEKEYLNEHKLNYQLTGILVHSGSTLVHGHYYSLIMDQETGEWYKFDDTKISNFDIKNIEYECFGDDKENNNNYYQFSKCHNAYLLFYTRKESLNYKKFLDNNLIDNKIKNKVKKENVDFLKMKVFASQDFYDFFKKLIQNEVNSGNYEEVIYKYNKYINFIKTEKEVNLFEKFMISNKENSNQQQNNMNEIYEKCKEEVQIRNNELEKNIPERIKTLKNIPLSRDLYDKFILYYYISEKIIKMNY